MVQCVKISVNGSRTLYSQGNWDFLLFEIDPNHAGTPCMLQNVHFWGGSQVERIPSCYFAVWNFLLKGRTHFQILKSKFCTWVYEIYYSTFPKKLMSEAEKWTVKIKQDICLTNPLLFELWNMLLNRIKSNSYCEISRIIFYKFRFP